MLLDHFNVKIVPFLRIQVLLQGDYDVLGTHTWAKREKTNKKRATLVQFLNTPLKMGIVHVALCTIGKVFPFQGPNVTTRAKRAVLSPRME